MSKAEPLDSAEWGRARRPAIVTKLAEGLPVTVAKALDRLLEVEEGAAVSGLQAIKANPAHPSPAAMQGLAAKLTTIEATGILAVDLSWGRPNSDTGGEFVLGATRLAATPV